MQCLKNLYIGGGAEGRVQDNVNFSDRYPKRGVGGSKCQAISNLATNIDTIVRLFFTFLKQARSVCSL